MKETYWTGRSKRAGILNPSKPDTMSDLPTLLKLPGLPPRSEIEQVLDVQLDAVQRRVAFQMIEQNAKVRQVAELMDKGFNPNDYMLARWLEADGMNIRICCQLYKREADGLKIPNWWRGESHE
jgi:hypothetical protein